MIKKFNEYLLKESVIIKYEDFKEVPDSIDEIFIEEYKIELKLKNSKYYGVIEKYDESESVFIIRYYQSGEYLGKTFADDMFKAKYKLVNILLTLKRN